MLKRLTRKFFILFVLCAALTTVASAPAPASCSNSKWPCWDMPLSDSCSSGYLCCDRWGNCTCA